MVVVMAIIAVIMLLGVSALISARDQEVLKNAAEQLKTDIRKVQNRAISIQGECDGDPGIKPKIWALTVIADPGASNYKYTISYWCRIPGTTPKETWNPVGEETVELGTEGLTMSILGSPTPLVTTYAFSAPVGKFTQVDKLPDDLAGSTIAVTGPSGPDEAYLPAASEPLAPGQRDITLSFKGKSIKVIIDPNNGTVRVE